MTEREAIETEGSEAYCCEKCGCTEPEEVTGGWRCSKCSYQPPECTCYEVTGGHQPGCYFNRKGPETACQHWFQQGRCIRCFARP